MGKINIHSETLFMSMKLIICLSCIFSRMDNSTELPIFPIPICHHCHYNFSKNIRTSKQWTFTCH